MNISDRLRSLFDRRKTAEPHAAAAPIPNRAARRLSGFVRRGPLYKLSAPAIPRYFRRHGHVAAIPTHLRTRRQRKQFARSLRAFQQRYR